jgi:enhancing lycopene biosynthesis protein 2
MSDEAKTGYGRPPRTSQFKKGHSGNPKGRTKGSSSLKTDLANILEKRLPISENGEQRLVSGREVMLLKLFEKAVKGDIRATAQIFAMLTKLDASDSPRPEPEIVTDNDRVVVAEFVKRYLRSKGEAQS